MTCSRGGLGAKGQRFELRGKLNGYEDEQPLAWAATLATANRLAYSFRRWPQCDPKSVRIVDRQAEP